MNLPLFPLGLVLYPNERLPLHIFEPRYKQMVQECLDADRPFGIVLFQDGSLSRVGCAARIDDVLRTYPDGRMDIVVVGKERIQIRDVKHDRAYLQADVQPVAEAEAPSSFPLRERAITQHMKLLELAGRSPSPTVYDEHSMVSFFLAHNVGLSVEQKQQVLELSGEKERIAFLVDHMEAFIPRVEQAEELRRKVQSNGHFPDFPPSDAPDDALGDTPDDALGDTPDDAPDDTPDDALGDTPDDALDDLPDDLPGNS